MVALVPESWVLLPGYEGLYEVSNLGFVRSLKTGVVLTPRWHPLGKPPHQRYLTVRLQSADGKRKWMKVHKAVLIAFVGPCPPGMEGCHYDDDKTNNTLTNLRWDTRAANAADNLRNGNHSMARKTHCPDGHPYDAANTDNRPNGSRRCKTCHREQERNRRTSGQIGCPGT
jgi:hypothetical protein